MTAPDFEMKIVNSLDTLTKTVPERFFFSAVVDFPSLQYGELVFGEGYPAASQRILKRLRIEFEKPSVFAGCFFFQEESLKLFRIAIYYIDLTIKSK